MFHRSLNETAFSVDLVWQEVYKTPARRAGHFLSTYEESHGQYSQ